MKQLGWMGLMLLLSGVAAAQEEPKPAPEPEHKPGTGYDVGDFHFAPRIKIKSQFDDNIFLENERATEPDDDVYFILNPSIRIDFNPGEEFTATAGYELNQWWAADHNEGIRTEHDAALSARWQPTNLFYLRTDNRFVDAVQPINSTITNQVEILAGSYAIAPGLSWAYDILELEIAYRRLDSGEEVNEIDLLRFFEHDVWEFTLRERHQFTDEFSAGVEFYVGWTDFFGTDAGRLKQDNEYWGPRLVAGWNPVDEVTLSGSVEYQHRNYERGTGILAFDQDFSGILFNTGLVWQPSRNDRFTLGGGRRIAESPITNYVRSWYAAIGYTRVITDDLALNLGGNAALGTESDEAVLQDRKLTWAANMTMYWRFEPGWMAEAGGEYRDKRTNDRTGEYENWRATVGVGYTF